MKDRVLKELLALARIQLDELRERFDEAKRDKGAAPGYLYGRIKRAKEAIAAAEELDFTTESTE